MAEMPAEPPFVRTGPDRPTSPVVISVPHAGRAYSQRLLDDARLPLEQIGLLEDRLMDRLVWRAVASGCRGVVAAAPRAEIDLNRDEREVDPAMIAPQPAFRRLLQTPRLRGGLGLIPSRIGDLGPIWSRRISATELERRLGEVHRPYHAALEHELQAARSRFGIAILLDCHSMPPRIAGERRCDVVLGDRYGTAISSDLIEACEHAAQAAGFATVRNRPYAGGYITQRHGRPAAGVHALQIEIDRSLYLDDQLMGPGAGFERAACLIEQIAAAMAARGLEPPHALAAE